MPSPAVGASRIGVDIGGTFTDLVWVDEATGAVRVAKLLTTPKEPPQAVEQGVLTLLTTNFEAAYPALYRRTPLGVLLETLNWREARESTTVVGPGAHVSVDPRLNLLAEPAS